MIRKPGFTAEKKNHLINHSKANTNRLVHLL